jgi:hypothetical protein
MLVGLIASWRLLALCFDLKLLENFFPLQFCISSTAAFLTLTDKSNYLFSYKIIKPASTNVVTNLHGSSLHETEQNSFGKELTL